ncbi:hypothetical protein ACQ5SO_14815 [Rhodovulum sp. DZ06]|uniref:hypothetical protein n=1 Tax=Rhodovulum sp. DZ06 TaxID=3425126 RepID=UPI003D348FBC
MLRPAALCVSLALALAAPAAAADWSERDICRAGIQTFFDLPEAPIDDASADFRDHMGFEGRNGIIRRQYACRVQKDRIAIRWFVDGHRKRDARTTWEVDGDALVIHARNAEARFPAE